MIFNSLDFFLFLAVVLPLYFFLPLWARQVLLFAASMYFYMYWNVKYSGIIFFFIVLDFFAGQLIGTRQTPTGRRLALLLSLGCNLGVLVVFKYYNFFMNTAHHVGLLSSLPVSGLLLPLGISFHTFQTMSYTIDVYRGVLKPERNILRFAVFVSLFPQMVAGPIERAKDLLPQISIRHVFSWSNMVIGGRRVVNGFVKKVVLADNIAPFVNRTYAAPGDYSGFSLLVSTWLFAWQIYFDFSGYTDIAIGVARVMGFQFSENFDMPYISTSIKEFWRRWHMSLSSWLRDYLYIALGGSRKGRLRTYSNLLATMLLGGLWHGASWNFVIWGAMHGTWLAMERLWTEIRMPRLRVLETLDSYPMLRAAGRAAAAVLVFHGVCLTWIFFRAETLGSATTIVSRVLRWAPGAPITHEFVWVRLLLILGFGAMYFLAVHLAEKRDERLYWATSIAAVQAVILFGAGSNEFIYFVF